MMKNINLLINLFLISILGMMGASCTYYESDPPEIPAPPERAYVGSQTCGGCHADIYATFSQTGHPFILSEVTDGKAPDFPFTTLEHLPEGKTWDNLSFVVGGYAWKAHYLDANGYLVTGDDAQWNIATQEAVPYHADVAAGSKVYDCGQCHTTGWESIADGANSYNDLDGIDGNFFQSGVHCEACHGMGSFHVSTKSKDEINVDVDPKACNNCHSRNDGAKISASDGFIHNYAQYDELKSSPHKDLSCTDCHNPHGSSKHGQMTGIVKSCTECHTDITKGATHNGADCITCHMPQASRSAVEFTKYRSDVKTHIFKINPAADGKMFNDDGSEAIGTTGVTLAYTCYQCHKDLYGEGGRDNNLGSTKALSTLSERATGYHDN